jgi:hypothetical protein
LRFVAPAKAASFQRLNDLQIFCNAARFFPLEGDEQTTHHASEQSETSSEDESYTEGKRLGCLISMKKKSAPQSAFSNLRVSIFLGLLSAGILLALFALGASSDVFDDGKEIKHDQQTPQRQKSTSGVPVIASYRASQGKRIKTLTNRLQERRHVMSRSQYVGQSAFQGLSGGVQEEWVASYNGPGNQDDHAYAVVVDGSGNTYVTGYSASTNVFPFNLDYATIKYDASGAQLWVARYNGTGDTTDYGNAIAIDGSGNVYVTGESTGSGTGLDYATIKYNASGVVQWVARYNGPGNGDDQAFAIAVDGSGNVYVTGTSTGLGTGPDYATIKYNSSGTEEWVARYNGPGNAGDFCSAIAVDDSGNVYVTGQSTGSGTSFDYATIKYDASGAQEWAVRYNGPGNFDDYAFDLVIDGSSNVYVTGVSFGADTDFDYATIKYDTSGAQQWVARYNGPGNFNDGANALAIDGSGNIYVTGYSTGLGTSGLPWDYATVKYNASGAEEWVARYNGPGDDYDEAAAVAVDDSGNVYVTGASTGLGSGLDSATIKYNASGTEEWVARYSGAANSDDYCSAIALDGSGNVYAAGGSIGADTGDDYLTIKYSQSSACQLRVFLVYTDSTPPNNLRTQLLADPDVSVVDLFDARTDTPTLSQLQQYDIVYAFSNNPYADGTTLGNNLADYQDGGGVVVAGFASFFGSTLSIEGRWHSGGYSPYDYNQSVVFNAVTLGVHDTTHPLMQGVTTLNALARIPVSLAAGATQVAAYSDTSSAVAFKTTASTTAVGMPAYIGDGNNSGSGDYATIIANAGRWLHCAPTPTPTPSPSPTPTTTPTATATATPTPTATATATPTSTPTATATATFTPTPTPTATATPTATPTSTPTATATATFTPTPTPTATATPTPTATATPTATPTATQPPPSPTPTATATPTATPAVTPRQTPTPRPRPTAAPRPS